MTSEEKAEKKRVEKRLLKALKLREEVTRRYVPYCESDAHAKFSHECLVLDRRIHRIETTLRAYD